MLPSSAIMPLPARSVRLRVTATSGSTSVPRRKARAEALAPKLVSITVSPAKNTGVLASPNCEAPLRLKLPASVTLDGAVAVMPATVKLSLAASPKVSVPVLAKVMAAPKVLLLPVSATS